VGIPIASTLKTREGIRVQELLTTVRSDLTRSELEELSDRAIDWILENACQEPANQEIAGVTKGSKGSLKSMIASVIKSFKKSKST
jgi:hypothetical protein